MADSRRLQSIASRYDLEVERHPNRLQRYRRWVTFAAVPLAVAVSLTFLAGDHRGLQSRPVSSVHQSFEQSCQACHDRSFQPLHRLVTLDNSIHSVSEDACRRCHVESSRDHIEHDLVATTLLAHLAGEDQAHVEELFAASGCAGCHQEHRGASLLATVQDRHCSECHQQASLVAGAQQFSLDFDQFADHPEFAVLRVGDAGARDRHRSLQLTTLTDSVRTDRARIRFSHHRHLDPELPNAKREVRELRCQDCHELDPSGAHFQPISFTRHCEQCHQLGFADTGVLPHVAPEIIRGLLLDRLASSDPPSASGNDPLGGLTNRDSSPSDDAADRWSILQARLSAVEQRLFGQVENDRLPPRPQALLETACAKCHFSEPAPAEDQTSWTILPPKIPPRWLSHALFRHDRHDAVQCDQCHSKGADELLSVERDGFYPELSTETARSPSIFASQSARDILMPSIDVCRTCHDSRQAESGRAAVAADCVTCHAYHHESVADAVSSQWLQFLTQDHNSKSP